MSIASRSVREPIVPRRASAMADGEYPLSMAKVTLRLVARIEDRRGVLSVGELPTDLPFSPERYFLVFDVPGDGVRGQHASRSVHHLLVCAHGECTVAVDDGSEQGEVVLDRPDVALHVPPMVWSSQYRFSADGVLLALASAPYDPDAYIRDHAEFLRATRGG